MTANSRTGDLNCKCKTKVVGNDERKRLTPVLYLILPKNFHYHAGIPFQTSLYSRVKSLHCKYAAWSHPWRIESSGGAQSPILNINLRRFLCLLHKMIVLFKTIFYLKNYKIFRKVWGSNLRLSDCKNNALPTAPSRQCVLFLKKYLS